MSEPPPPRLHELLVRWRFVLCGLLLSHFILAHYFVLGFVSWDGFGHRVPPVVELVKHGSLGLEKYANWALVGFRPFVELANAPFLYAFGLDGLYFAFALTLLPFCIAAVFLFTREVTQDANAAFYAAATYLLTPLVNSQVFSGYVDWSIPGLLAFFLYALLALGRAEVRKRSYAKVVLGTFLFTMSRQQAPYLSVFFLVIVACLLFVERQGWRVALRRRTVLGVGAVAFLVGLTPSVVFQLVAYLRHGTPIYPYQFNMLGLKVGEGVDYPLLCALAGLKEYSVSGFLEASRMAWIIPPHPPYSFFDSRYLGAGLFFITALVTLPLVLRRATFATRVLLAAFIFTSLAAKDFFLPRYAYTIVLSLCLCNGVAISALLDRKPRALFYAATAVLVLHALRPEWDVYRIRAGDNYPRMNASNSSLFIKGDFDIPMYPDLGAQFVIAHAPGANFILPIYGQKLSNSVIDSVPKSRIGPRCEGLREFQKPGANVLVIDDEDLTKDCARTCVASNGRCLAYRLESN